MFIHWYILNHLIEREMINEQLMQKPPAWINKCEPTTFKKALIITYLINIFMPAPDSLHFYGNVNLFQW